MVGIIAIRRAGENGRVVGQIGSTKGSEQDEADKYADDDGFPRQYYEGINQRLNFARGSLYRPLNRTRLILRSILP